MVRLGFRLETSAQMHVAPIDLCSPNAQHYCSLFILLCIKNGQLDYFAAWCIKQCFERFSNYINKKLLV